MVGPILDLYIHYNWKSQFHDKDMFACHFLGIWNNNDSATFVQLGKSTLAQYNDSICKQDNQYICQNISSMLHY